MFMGSRHCTMLGVVQCRDKTCMWSIGPLMWLASRGTRAGCRVGGTEVKKTPHVYHLWSPSLPVAIHTLQQVRSNGMKLCEGLWGRALIVELHRCSQSSFWIALCVSRKGTGKKQPSLVCSAPVMENLFTHWLIRWVTTLFPPLHCGSCRCDVPLAHFSSSHGLFWGKCLPQTSQLGAPLPIKSYCSIFVYSGSSTEWMEKYCSVT